jgi:hypothetical protein
VFYFVSKTFNVVEAQVQSDEIYEKAVMEFRKREHVTFVDNPVECFEPRGTREANMNCSLSCLNCIENNVLCV